ncbi:MAG: retropepsin-like aspartic protease [Patescibacteria group bacterium]
MKFKYSRFSAQPSDAFPDLKEVWRPVIPVKISYEKKEYGYLALVDSGADFCIFHADIAEALGLSVKKGKTSPIFGVTKGEGKVYYHYVDLEIGGWKINSYVGFSYDLRFPLGILGQRGFFEFFSIDFDLRKRIVDLRPKYL